MAKKRGLGKGLGALLGEVTNTVESQSLKSIQGVKQEQMLLNVPIEKIRPGPYQPRRDIAPEALEELAASIREQGIMQPIVLRFSTTGEYEIIAGERRWRAAQLVKLEVVPAVVREVSDSTAVALALIENIQREELTPIETAIALQRLQQEFGLTQQEVAEQVGKSRTTVTNLLRLLRLTDHIRIMLERGDIEMGHARAILTLEESQQIELAQQIVSKGLSVRQAEVMAKKLKEADLTGAKKEKKDPNITSLEQKLSGRLCAPVQIQYSRSGKGKLIIQYTGLDQLDSILDHIK